MTYFCVSLFEIDLVKLVVGLGNPGRRYAKTRHNIGFRVADRVVKLLVPSGAKWQLDKRVSSTYITCPLKGREVVVAKPISFMNQSGIPLKALAERFKLLPQDIIVIHDDKDIILGKFKTQINRGAAGHNGVKSIISSLETQEFHRLRIGVASDNRNNMEDTVKFVLGRFGFLERGLVKTVINSAAEQIIDLI